MSQETYRILVDQLKELSLPKTICRRPKIYPNMLYSPKAMKIPSQNCLMYQESLKSLRSIGNIKQDSEHSADLTTSASLISSSPYHFYNVIHTEPEVVQETVSKNVKNSSKPTDATDEPRSGKVKLIASGHAKCPDSSTNHETSDDTPSSLSDFMSDDTDLSDYERGESYSPQEPFHFSFGLDERNIADMKSPVPESAVFPYPEFLPPSLSLKFLSTEPKQKELFEYSGTHFGSIINRLLEMEKLQQLTIQKEKSKELRSQIATPRSKKGSYTKNGTKLKRQRQRQPDCTEICLPLYDYEPTGSKAPMVSNNNGHCSNTLSARNHSARRPRTACESRKISNRKPSFNSKRSNFTKHSLSATFCSSQTLYSPRSVTLPSKSEIQPSSSVHAKCLNASNMRRRSIPLSYIGPVYTVEII
ncbi:protein FAM217A-like [Polypterus senegalus]|uniref:protein FAM217A-like n=1 Tax=Polypterus senegalus TaxID=55291 RepID=UPI0019641001|nr:protein FAM217A-like [Polypterus senegalus]